MIRNLWDAFLLGLAALAGVLLWVFTAYCAVNLYVSFMTPSTRCTIETMRGTLEYGTGCVDHGGRLQCNEKTYGMYLSYVCKKGEK